MTSGNEWLSARMVKAVWSCACEAQKASGCASAMANHSQTRRRLKAELRSSMAEVRMCGRARKRARSGIMARNASSVCRCTRCAAALSWKHECEPRDGCMRP